MQSRSNDCGNKRASTPDGDSKNRSIWSTAVSLAILLSTWYCIQGMMTRIIGIGLVCMTARNIHSRSNLNLSDTHKSVQFRTNDVLDSFNSSNHFGINDEHAFYNLSSMKSIYDGHFDNAFESLKSKHESQAEIIRNNSNRGHSNIGIINLSSVFITSPLLDLNETYKSVRDSPFNLNDLRNKRSLQNDNASYDFALWTYNVQASIVAAHDWGELFMLMVSGRLLSPERLRIFLAISACCSLFITGLFPLFVQRFDYWGAIINRTFLGFAHAFSSPCVSAIIAAFLPESTRSTVYSIALSGNQMASVVVNSVVAYFCSTKLFDQPGWTAGFYFIFFTGFIWLIAWLLVSRTYEPRQELHRRNIDSHHRVNMIRILKFSPVWCLLPCSIAAIWTTRFLMYYMPNYFRDVLRLPLTKNGLYSSLPFAALCFSKPFYTLTSAYIERKKWLSKNVASKCFNTLAFAGSGAIILICRYGVSRKDAKSGGSDYQLVAYMTLAGALFSANSAGFRRSVVSINHRYTAQISSCLIMASMAGAIVLPYVVGALVKSGRSWEWHNVFICVAFVNFSATVAYLMFGSVDEHDFVGKIEQLYRNSDQTDGNESGLLIPDENKPLAGN